MAKAKTEIRSLARSHTATAITTLSRIMRSAKAPASARVAAATALLDRGWGKPTQMIAGDPEGEPIELKETCPWDDRELARRVALILHRADPQHRKEN